MAKEEPLEFDGVVVISQLKDAPTITILTHQVTCTGDHAGHPGHNEPEVEGQKCECQRTDDRHQRRRHMGQCP